MVEHQLPKRVREEGQRTTVSLSHGAITRTATPAPRSAPPPALVLPRVLLPAPLPPRDDDEIAGVTAAIAKRIVRLLKRRGLPADEGTPQEDLLLRHEALLAGCAADSILPVTLRVPLSGGIGPDPRALLYRAPPPARPIPRAAKTGLVLVIRSLASALRSTAAVATW